MAATIYFRVGQKDEITLREFLTAGQDLLRLLRELDASISHDSSGSVQWNVSFLAKNSPPEIGVTAKRRPHRNDTSEAVQRAVIDGSLALRLRGERPREYSDAALKTLLKIADKSQRLGPSLIYTREQGVLKEQEAQIDISTARRVQEFTAPRSRAWGTLTGRLDTISVRRGLEFRIIDDETKNPVRSRFVESDLDQVKALLGFRIIASGIVHANSSGLPLRLEVEGEIRALESEELPSIERMIGLVPDLTGGLSLLEFLGEDGADEPHLLGH